MVDMGCDMNFQDIWWVLDRELPFWVNDGENTMYYKNKNEALIAPYKVDYTDRKVQYITLDGSGVLTIELWEV